MLSAHLRAAVRAFRVRPLLSLVRIATVALVAGAATAVLLVVNATMLRPLPFERPDRLVRIYTQPPGTTEFAQANPLHPLEFVRFRAAPGALEAVEGVWAQDRAVAGDGDPESVRAAAITAGLFPLLGARPVVGRTFTEAEAAEGQRVVVLSHGLWTRRYGAAPSAIGRTMQIDREPYEIIGVMGPEFEPVFVRSEFWTPLPIREGNLVLPGATFIQTVGRLSPGASIERVRAELEAKLTVLTQESPVTLKGWSVKAIDLRRAQYGTQAPALILLLAAVVALALIAAANLANLTLADVVERRTELVVRMALGATRRQLLGPEVLHAVLLASAGTLIGILLGAWLLPWLISLDPAIQLPARALHVEWLVVAGAFALSLLVMLTAAVVPAARVASRDLSTGLAEGVRRMTGGIHHERIRTWLVGAQTAMALLLLASGGLIAAALDRTVRADPGYDRANVLTAQLRLADVAYANAAARAAFLRDVLTRVRALPGVLDAGTTQNLFVPGFAFVTLVHIEGKPTPDNQPHTIQFRRVSDGYFRTLRIRVIKGRAIDERDTVDRLPAGVVSQRFAARFWPGEDPIGRRVRRAGLNSPWITIVGVVGDVTDVGYGQVQYETLYIPYAQNNNTTAPISLVVRTEGDPRAHAGAVKAAVWEVDPAQPLSSVATLATFLDDSLGPQRFRGVVLGVLAVLGLALAGVGTYGVTARTVAERTREAGVRMALGGQPRAVWWTLALRGLRALAAGAVAGAAGMAVAIPVLRTFFPEVSEVSSLVALPAAVLLLGTGIAATLMAARRIVRLDPVAALRD